MTTTHPRGLDAATRTERLMDRFGRRIGAALSALQAHQPRHDIDERLRVAREQALARAREARHRSPATAGVSLSGGAGVLGGGPERQDTPWWLRLSSLLPLALLLAGLLLIDRHYTFSQIEAAAEVDAAILADDLPPEAYSDPGFVEYLKSARP